MDTLRTTVTIPVQPWYQDHHFQGSVVFPAVETMQLLARQVLAQEPGFPVTHMRDASFAKFLVIPAGANTLTVVIECSKSPAGDMHAKLLSRRQHKSISRMVEHGAVTFCQADVPDAVSPPSLFAAAELKKVIPAADIYQRMVPFGRAYRTLTGDLQLSEHCAQGWLLAPDFPLADEIRNTLGSPFPLDGALHAACVLGQQMVDYIPFPVGFAQRIIYRPTDPGKKYRTCATLVSRSADTLIFDIDIFTAENILHEAIRGVRMKDVSGAAR